ncbi:MAG: hypothetical protein IID46_11520, partial [Planctomycetes bacterium]|nr:hypothetical protein [Planctomycetota bacterium]
MSRFISACFLLGVLTIAAVAQTASTDKPVEAKKPQPTIPRFKLTISKETTYLTEPLAKDGYINYERALNEQLSKGVTPENNAAVLFLRAYGPRDLPDFVFRTHRLERSNELRVRYFKMLGIEPLPEKGDYFVYFKNYLE